MARIERFEELKCWQEARALTKEVYQMSSTEPLAKDFRLCDQLTSAAVSVMSNIAEGFARYHKKDFIRFLDIAQSSAVEVKSLLYVVLDQGYAAPKQIRQLQQRCEATKSLTLGLLRHVHRTLEGESGVVKEPPLVYDSTPESPATVDLPEQFLSNNQDTNP